MAGERILVAGANGAVGREVVRLLAQLGGLRVRAATRRPCAPFPPGVEAVVVPDRGATTDWTAATTAVDVIINLAGTTRARSGRGGYAAGNVQLPLALARAGRHGGMTRFVQLSSLAVYGSPSASGPVRETDPLHPGSPYGASKLEAETRLGNESQNSGTELVIVRPPMVYGRGVRGSFRSLSRWVRSGLPLPFARVKNARSIVGAGNLADFLVVCARHPAAAAGVFHVSDGEDLSTPELVRRVARALNRPARLLPFSPGLLRGILSAAGLGELAEKLVGSCAVDISLARTSLGWSPRWSVDEGLRAALGPSATAELSQ